MQSRSSFTPVLLIVDHVRYLALVAFVANQPFPGQPSPGASKRIFQNPNHPLDFDLDLSAVDKPAFA
jgi:hypothetical protein